MKKLYNIAQNKYTMTVLMAVVVFLSLLSCNKKEEDSVAIEFDPEVIPSMVTDSVVTLISDSGITRYKLVADTWHIFDKAKEPYWYFPEGLYLERFDENLDIEATIIADSAWNFTNKSLWRLKGNVEITNMDGDEFRSDELFWNQAEEKVYSDKYIEIKQKNTELKGYGFESNQEMTVFEIFRPHDGKYPFEEKPLSTTDDENQDNVNAKDSITIAKDSIKQLQ